MTNLFKSSKGSIIPESAMVIPLVIILTASVLTLMMDFYDLVLAETQEDNKIFKQGFNEAENIRHSAVIGDLFDEEK